MGSFHRVPHAELLLPTLLAQANLFARPARIVAGASDGSHRLNPRGPAVFSAIILCRAAHYTHGLAKMLVAIFRITAQTADITHISQARAVAFLMRLRNFDRFHGYFPFPS